MILSGRRAAAIVTLTGSLVGSVGAAVPAYAAPNAPAGTPSNLGLCSPFLAGLPSPLDPATGEPLGGNARSGVNLLIVRYGEMQPDGLSNPGELYRIRAHEHPTASAADECLPRRQP